MYTKKNRRGLVGLATVALAAGGSATLPAAAAATSEDDGQPTVTSQTASVELTHEEADELRARWEAGEELSPHEALDVAGVEPNELEPADDGAQPASILDPDEGYGESLGECSRMTLWGDSEGRWTWTNKFFARSIGPAAFGRGTVTTNGMAASSDSFDISGLEQLEGDQLYFAGFLPGYTIADAWSLNYNLSGSPTFCFGMVYAQYE